MLAQQDDPSGAKLHADVAVSDMRPTQVIPVLLNGYLQHRSAALEEDGGAVIACLLGNGDFMILPLAAEHRGWAPKEIGALASARTIASAVITPMSGTITFQTPLTNEPPMHIVAVNPVLVDFQMGDARQTWALVGLDGAARINGVETIDVGYGADLLQVYRVENSTLVTHPEDSETAVCHHRSTNSFN